MRIVGLVAINALRPDPLPDLIHMAGVAFYLGMRAEQREGCAGVVEAHTLPAIRHMAGRAVCA